MRSNVGSADRNIRAIVAVALLSLFFFLEGNTRWLGLLGVVLIGTGFIGFCPLYKLLGQRTIGS